MYRFEIEEETGILRQTITGFMTPADAQKLNREFIDVVRNCRARFGRVRVLVDAMAGPVQSKDTADAFVNPMETLTGPDDRCAVVLGSMLVKMQSERIISPNDRIRTFSSIEDGRQWLEEN